jgi:glycosyltransferase involved in cell wall biosynthesis
VPVRIAITVNSLRRDGGAERMVCLVANAFAAEGHDVAVFTRIPPEFGHQPVSDDVAVTPMYTPRGDPKWLRNLQLPLVVASLTRHLRRFKPDVVLGQKWDGAILALLATTSTPVIAWEQGYMPAAYLSRAWRILRGFTYPRAAAVVLVNRASFERAAELVDPKVIRVIPNFAGEWPLRPGGPSPSSKWHDFPSGPPPHKLLALGRLEPEKGFDLLISSFARVASEFPDWGLLIVGGGSQDDRLRGLVATHGLHGRVHLPGAVSDPWPTIYDSDAFVMSSLHEGFPVALVEAMGAGLPVVSFDCPAGPGELITDGVDGLLVAPEDEAALADAFRRLFADPDLRARLATNAVAVRDRLSQDRLMRTWNSLLAELAGS